MAKLSDKTYPMPEQDIENWENWIYESNKALENIPEERLFYTSYADGNAYYYVESFSPLILQHVPYLDAWQLPYSHIKGLTKKEVEQNINSHITWRKYAESQRKLR